MIDLYLRMVDYNIPYFGNASAKVQNKMEISGTKVVRLHPACICYCTSEYFIGFRIFMLKELKF